MPQSTTMTQFVVIATLLFFPVSALRPKDAYEADAEAMEKLSVHNGEEGRASDREALAVAASELQQSQRGNASASNAAMEARTATKLSGDPKECRKLAVLLSRLDWCDQNVWAVRKNSVKSLKNDDTGDNMGWKKIFNALADAQKAAKGVSDKLGLITREIDNSVSKELALAGTKVLAKEIIHNYLNTYADFEREPVERDDEVGLLVKPLQVINGQVQLAVTKAYSEKDLAKHFENFWTSRGFEGPGGGVITFGDDETPETVVNDILSPIAALLQDLGREGDFGDRGEDWSDYIPNYYIKQFLERCTPDEGFSYKLDPQGGDEFDKVTDDARDSGDYISDIRTGFQTVNSLPKVIVTPDGGWTAPTR